jgi:hypothetical protein
MSRFKQTVQKNFGATRAPFHRKNVLSADDKLVTKVVIDWDEIFNGGQKVTEERPLKRGLWGCSRTSYSVSSTPITKVSSHRITCCRRGSLTIMSRGSTRRSRPCRSGVSVAEEVVGWWNGW